jgi:TolA-binding protein
MSFASRFPSAAIVCLAGSMLAGGPAAAQAPAPAPASLDVQLMQKAEQLSNEGKHSEAAAAYEELVTKFPQVPSVPEANFRAGYAHYIAGEYDAAIAAFKRVLDNKNLPPELAQLAELSLSMTPQVLAAKAGKLQPNDPGRNAALEEAVKQFDIYLQKYPNSDEAESATYGKALALYQVAKYEPAIDALRGNLKKFEKSPTVQDSQYLLALTLATLANVSMQKATAVDKTAETNYDEAEKLLRDIINKRQNLALMNDAQFQVGELLLARGGFMTGPDEKDKQAATFAKAIEAYRSVATKDIVVAAQKNRIAQFTDLRNKAGIAKDKVQYDRFKRVVDKEQEKLAQLEGRTDQTLTAKIKTGVIYFAGGKLDETRVLFTQLDNLGVIEDPEDKKQALYFITMSYALQNVADKAVEKYNAFQATYKADPIAQNLQLVMGAMYLTEKLNDPDKAIQYFNEGIEIYPKGKNLGTLVLARAQAQIQLKKFGDAETALKATIATKPAKELAVDAEFYLGTIYGQTGKLAEAVVAFKGVRDKYPGTSQAEQATFQVGQLLSSIDPKSAVPELQSFITKFPKSTLLPPALFALGNAEAATNQSDAALTTFKKLAADFPKSDPAPFSYFERAKILSGAQKFDECLAVMKEFIAKYPDSPQLYQAYDFTAQIQSSQSKSTEAIATYEEFVAKRPKDAGTPEALLKLSALWKAYADSQGPYLVLDEAKRAEWKKGVEKSTAAAELLITDFPESQQVAQALNNLLDTQRLQQAVQLKTADDLEKYFQNLAAKFADKPGTQAKVLFTLAAFTFDKDKAKGVAQMTAAYKPDLKFAPEDLDLYGEALIENKKFDEAAKVYEKLGKDFPVPKGVDPKGASHDVQEAQAIILAGMGKALQEKGDKESKDKAGKMFADLEKLYPWSPKMLEVNYGIALDLHDKGQDDDAMKRLFEVIKAQKASAELRAKSMLLLGKIHEAAKRFEMAIDNYLKISVYYGGVPKVAAEGLWLGAQLLERQATGEIPMPTPTPKPTAAPKPAAKPAAAADKKK